MASQELGLSVGMAPPVIIIVIQWRRVGKYVTPNVAFNMQVSVHFDPSYALWNIFPIEWSKINFGQATFRSMFFIS